ncbi:MAG: TlpA family protein disulfide reductase [Sphingobacterium sp.]|jgi:thiol-disulfide isomerase/thioredoxin|nr:TlpA family protein disulfide reductase [Sphingobacterium sp.]
MIKKSKSLTALLDKVVNIPVIQITILVILFILVSMFSLSAQTPRRDSGAEGPTPLQVGDTIPESLWSMPLQVINHPDGKTITTLSDYRGSLIILDFWATSCGSCISALPKLTKLQHSFKDIRILPVTANERELITAFLSKSPNLMGDGLPYIVAEKNLQKYFPHLSIPHVVWINAEGKIINIGYGEYVTADNIKLAIEKKLVDLPIKIDFEEDHYDEPLIRQLAKTKDSVQILESSILTGYLPFADLIARFKQDSISNSTRYYAFNHSLNHLFTLALRSSLPLNRKRCVMHVKSPQRFMYGQGELFFQDWLRKYAYSYEIVLPYLASMNDIRQRLRNDLEGALRLKSEVKEMPVQCLVLSYRKDHKKNNRIKSNVTKKERFDTSSFTSMLNNDTDLPLVVDEVNDADLDILLADDWKTVADLNTGLRKYGLELIPASRTMKMFLLEDKSPKSL